MREAETVDIAAEPHRLGEAGYPAFRIAAGFGAVGVIGSLVLALVLDGGTERFHASWLVALAFWLSLALGALYFVLLQHLTRSGWSVVVRRLAEGVTAAFPLLALAAVPVLLGLGVLYGWARHDEGGHDMGAKGVWLSPAFFTARLVLYFAVWTLLARRLTTLSARQDESGDPALTARMERWSAPGMLLFGATVTMAAIDLLMSMDPHWYSTIFGVYYFAGSAVGIFALLPILAVLTQRAGRLQRAITTEHYHDLGKQLFGYVVFWAYIAFSQYMLIWYADIQEETTWFLRRQEHGWEVVGQVLLYGHFAIPFLALLSREPKRRPAVLAAIAAWLLVMHAVDLYWLIVPELSPGSATPHLLDLTCLVGLGGLFAAAVVHRLSRSSLIPEKDPRLAESVAFENV